ncbi:MAG: hypothetical protein ACQEW2_02390 [Bacillota bacterium]|uniref:hypothetical protein n=1 Tax=Cytobacillus firmus TaxID=1399 RepID=UPI0018CFD4AB|nr:hypothetical protein [Cytobacillus firmus]MBG9603962.1 hypothetical protein [Cytobacillus firmus]MBG9656058.1 hypothetical protein [Cytobacillus firmus]MED1907873.1 hypothetical protein [Cytobacillus firmus]
MLNKFKNSLLGHEMYLHEKKVEIPKLTPDRWKRLFEKVDMLPGLIVQVLLAPKKDFYTVVVSACQLALDEVTDIVALLSEVEVEYIRKNVALHEIIEFLTKTVQRNKLDEMAKNLKSLLPQETEE